MFSILTRSLRSRSGFGRGRGVLAPRLAALAVIALVLDGCAYSPSPVAADRPVKIVMLGDSIGAGFGLPWDAYLPARLEQVLREKGNAVSIVNEGVSGDTASDGLRRLDRDVPEGTDAVIIELGPNDAEKGIDPNVTKAALGGMLQKLERRHIQVLITGMRAFPSSGPAYARAFDAIYPALAARYSFVFYPYILDGVEGDRTLIQIDGEHPNAEGVNVMVERMLPKVEELIARARAARGT
jgi:acyl-CoA thioesterase I